MSALTRGGTAGLAGTAAMTATALLHARLRPDAVDYDMSDAPAVAASKVLRVRADTVTRRRLLFTLVHWGYGSAVGTGWLLVRSGAPSDTRATVRFFLVVEAMALVLLPVLGDTPPPWRWRADVLATSLAQHAVYAGVTGAVAARTAGRVRPPAA